MVMARRLPFATGDGRFFIPVCWLVIAVHCLSAAAQEPHVVNAKMRTAAAGGGLASAFRSIESGESGPVWIGYAVPVVPGEHRMCCNGSISDNSEEGCGRCRLEDRNGEFIGQSAKTEGAKAVKLESSPSFLVLYRAATGKIEKIRTFSPECELDAGGLAFIWLTGVQPAESVAWLSGFVKAEGADAEGESGDDDGARPVHSTLLAAEIPICEHLSNLGVLPGSGFRFSAVPVKVAGLGTFPVRAFAVVE